MPRIIVTVPKKMHEALRQESNRTNAPVAALIREAIEEWAQKRDIDVRDTITWGGARDRSEESDANQGDKMAVAAVS